MKKILATIAAAAVIFTGANAIAAENPACVLMKFTDDTRFKLEAKALSKSWCSRKILEKNCRAPVSRTPRSVEEAAA